MQIALADYLQQSKLITCWDPNPFQPHGDGPWHDRNFALVVDGIASLLARYVSGKVSKHQLLHGKDNGPDKADTLSYWLYFQHHPGSEKWKLMGQRYWSIDAWGSWRDAGGKHFPKRGRFGDLGLVSEHVVPKKKLKERLQSYGPSNRAAIRSLLECNLCCVVTRGEDRRLVRDDHPNLDDPWLRYVDSKINLLHNPSWSFAEIQHLFERGLLGPASISPQ